MEQQSLKSKLAIMATFTRLRSAIPLVCQRLFHLSYAHHGDPLVPGSSASAAVRWGGEYGFLPSVSALRWLGELSR